MRKVIITGYFDKDDGPSVFVKNLSSVLKDNYDVKFISSRFSLKDFFCLVKSDVVILNSSNLMPLLILLISPFLSKKRYISVIHGELGLGMSASFKKTLLRLCEYSMLKLSDKIIFVSKLQLKRFIGRYDIKNLEKKSAVIFNGVDVGGYTLSEKNKSIVYVGGENESKGRAVIDSFIEIFSLTDAAKGYHFYLYGMSVEKEYRINNLHVVAKRKVPHKEIKSVYINSEIFLSLSKYETFGIACVEAYCLANKIVCFKDAGFLEAVNDENVFVVEEYNVDLFCNALIDALSNSYVSNPLKLRELSIEFMGDRYLEIIECGAQDL